MLAAEEPTELPGLRNRRWLRNAARLGGMLAGVAVAVVLASLAALATLPLFGFQTYVIYGGSMEPAIGLGALAIDRPVEANTLAVGDIVTFRRPEAQVPITHRIVAIHDQDGQRMFTTKGDANSALDPEPITLDGEGQKVLYSVPYAGYVFDFARGRLGRVLMLAAPLGLLAVLFLREALPSPRQSGRSRAEVRIVAAERQPVLHLPAGTAAQPPAGHLPAFLLAQLGRWNEYLALPVPTATPPSPPRAPAPLRQLPAGRSLPERIAA